MLNSCLQTVSKGQAYSDEFRIETGDNTLKWVHVRTSPMLSDRGDLLGHVGTIEDITDRKQAEAARDQIIREQAARQQAEAANRMKDEFLAIVSHELRTPLNSILGWSQLLLNRKLDESTIARALETIERNARSQAQLIEDILDVSQIIRGKLRLAMQPLSIIPIIESVIETVQPLASNKSIQIECQFDTTVGKVYADAERLKQIIWNLLSNAIKFTDENGQVTVKLSRVKQDDETQDDETSIDSPPPEKLTSPPETFEYAQIQIIDTGIGISADFLPYVFDRFRQADSTTTRPYGGLGLGLAIVRHLVEQHRGTIRADSEGEGKGATFTVALPLLVTSPSEDALELQNSAASALESSQNSPNGKLPSLNCIQVLVVEDHADTRDFVKMVLQESGADVTAVASVQEALQYLEQSRPHVLVSDIGMPTEDGYKLIRKVRDRESDQGNQIPAIALTAYVRAEDQAKALAAGFQMHVSKPVEPEELVAVVAKAVGRRV